MSYYTETGLRRLGEKMREERKRRGLTLRDLAILVGERTAHTTIERLEQGVFDEPKPNTLARIAPHLDMTIDEMLGIASERSLSLVKIRTCKQALPLLDEMPACELKLLLKAIQQHLVQVDKLENNATE